MTLFWMGLGLGLLHAFDSDHLVAVSTLSISQPSLRKTLNYSFHWSLGHSVVLIILGIYASVLGLQLPLFLSHWAELLVGVMLMVLGILTLYQLRNDIKANSQAINVTRKTPLMIGVIHGTAGSATILALIPAIQLASPLYTTLYLMCFAGGIFLSMSLFAIIFSRSQQKLAQYNQHFFIYFRAFIGLFALVLGFIWLL